MYVYIYMYTYICMYVCVCVCVCVFLWYLCMNYAPKELKIYEILYELKRRSKITIIWMDELMGAFVLNIDGWMDGWMVINGL